MNWGKKILAAYLLFVSGILVMVVKSMNQDQELVTTDYYAQELKYQQRIEDIKRTEALSASIELTSENNLLLVGIPKDMEQKSGTGTITVYCPNDQSKDLKRNFSFSGKNLTISVPYESKGNRYVKVSWTCDGHSYYAEKNIFIQ